MGEHLDGEGAGQHFGQRDLTALVKHSLAEERSSCTRTGDTQMPPVLALSWNNGQNLVHLAPDALSALGLLGVGMRLREATKLLPCAYAPSLLTVRPTN